MAIDARLLTSYGLLCLFLLGAGWLLLDADALRDDSEVSPKPYSLARVQLWWWTVLILASWILVFGHTQKLWELNTTCLTLLGLSGLTTTAGRIIDNRDRNQGGLARHQDRNGNGAGHFFTDILSDEHGLSVHRFQLVAFNLAFGVAFVIDTFSKLKDGHFPELGTETLTLLGLSSGTYVTIKAMENQPGRGASAAPEREGNPPEAPDAKAGSNS